MKLKNRIDKEYLYCLCFIGEILNVVLFLTCRSHFIFNWEYAVAKLEILEVNLKSYNQNSSEIKTRNPIHDQNGIKYKIHNVCLKFI